MASFFLLIRKCNGSFEVVGVAGLTRAWFLTSRGDWVLVCEDLKGVVLAGVEGVAKPHEGVVILWVSVFEVINSGTERKTRLKNFNLLARSIVDQTF